MGLWLEAARKLPFGANAREDRNRLPSIIHELRTLIEKELGTPSANEPTQYELIAFGFKAVWRPSEVFAFFSTARTNEARLKQLVNEFNQLVKKINEEQKILSDCMFVTEPSVEFVGEVCTIKGS